MSDKTAKTGLWHNPWAVFAPFLLLYLLIAIVFKGRALDGDAGTYLNYASNLLAGHYSPRGEVHLWAGPGYPLFLMPFVALGAPHLLIIMMNAVLRYLSVIFLYKAAALYVPRGTALVFSAFWALHFTTYELLPNINTESMTMCLVSLLAYYASLAFREESPRQARRRLLIAGGILGYLCLTKVLFGYVLAIVLPIMLLSLLARRQKAKPQKAVLMILIAFAVTLPYLVYTYQLTGRPFYWANSGGMSLYWMSTPHENEYGDWQSHTFSEGFRGRNTAAIRQNHEADYAEILQYRGVERDDLFKQKAIENIKANPQKYLANCVANANRLLFGFPNSFQYENLKFLKMSPNILVAGLLLYSLFVSGFNLRRIPYELLFLLVLIGVYLGLSTLVSAYPRMFLIAVPVLMLWFAFAIDRTIIFNLTFRSGPQA